MIFFTGIPDTRAAIVAFATGSASKLNANTLTLFQAAASQGSPVDMLVQVAEVLYANQASITDTDAQTAARTLAGQCAAFGAQNGFHDMATRGPGITAAMRRELGEAAPTGMSWPDPSADPTPKPSYTAASS